MPDALKFSLVLATLGRTEELGRFLAHLEQQTYRDFELIIVDQNPPGFLDALLGQFTNKFSLLHLRSGQGLSRARNVGLKSSKGDIIGFPDDDCWYAPDLLWRISEKFESSLVAGMSGRCIGPDGTNWSKFDDCPGTLNSRNLFKRATAATMFLHIDVVSAVGMFDEGMGIGAETPYHSAEEMDYLLRALSHGYVVSYDPNLCVYHEPSFTDHGPKSWKRARDYGRGFGYLLKKHEYPLWYKLYVISRAVGGFLVCVAQCDFPNAHYYFYSASGRTLGCFANE